MRDKFTVEEINLMCIYDTSSRNTLTDDLTAAFREIYDPDMIAIFINTIEKLVLTSDEEFSEIGFYAADDFIEQFIK
jgi:hypothetical protein